MPAACGIFRSLLTQLFKLLSESAEVEAGTRSFAFSSPPRFLLPPLHFLLFDQHTLLFYVLLAYLWAAVVVDEVKRLRQAIELVNEFWVDGEAVEFNFGGHERQRRLSILIITLCRFPGLPDFHVSKLFEFVDVR